MRKTKALKLEPGSIVHFWREGAAHIDYELGKVQHVTPKGGILLVPVKEVYNSGVSIRPIGPAEWFPYSRVQPVS